MDAETHHHRNLATMGFALLCPSYVLGGDLNILNTTCWRRDRQTIFSHSFEMKFNCLANFLFCFLNCMASGNATW